MNTATRKPTKSSEPDVWMIFDRDDAPVGRIVSRYDHYEYRDKEGIRRYGCLHDASLYLHVIGHAPINDRAYSWIPPSATSMGALWCLLLRHIDAIEKMLGYEDAEAIPGYQDLVNDWQGVFNAVGYLVRKVSCTNKGA